MTSQSTITQQPRQLSVNPECLKRAPRISEVPEPPADDKRFMSGPDQKFKMRLCELQCCLVLLGLSVVLCGRSADAQLGPELDLRRHRLLQRAKAIGVATQVSPTNFIQCEPQDICAVIVCLFPEGYRYWNHHTVTYHHLFSLSSILRSPWVGV